jgi:hypothetical protein
MSPSFVPCVSSVASHSCTAVCYAAFSATPKNEELLKAVKDIFSNFFKKIHQGPATARWATKVTSLVNYSTNYYNFGKNITLLLLL